MKPSARYNRTKFAIIDDDDDSSVESGRVVFKTKANKAKGKMPSRRTLKERMLRCQKVFNSGTWSHLEKQQFLIGLRKYGRGNWKKIGCILTTRSNIQIKSHGQKLVQRLDAGENIFAELEHPETPVLDKQSPRPTCTKKELPTISYVSSSSSDEEDDCASIDDCFQSSMPDSMDEWYDDDKLKKEESIVVMALIELADHPTKLSERITGLARATGSIATTFGVQL